MNWFTKTCRNMGLMVHHIAKPIAEEQHRTHEVKRETQEQQVSETVTLRRTTIEEIEVKPPQP